MPQAIGWYRLPVGVAEYAVGAESARGDRVYGGNVGVGVVLSEYGTSFSYETEGGKAVS